MSARGRVSWSAHYGAFISVVGPILLVSVS